MKTLAATALAALALAAPAGAAAPTPIPRLIVVAGPTIPKPVLIRDQAGLRTIYAALLAANHTVAANALQGRPLLTLALTWPKGSSRPAAARFWPASGDHPAAIALAGHPPAQAPTQALDTLYSRGVPTRLDGGTWGNAALLLALAPLGALAIIALAIRRLARLQPRTASEPKPSNGRAH